MLYINPLGPLDEDEDNKSNMVNFGFLKDNTKIEVTSQTNIVKIKSKNMKTKAVTKFNFKFDEMGIGGLDKEIGDIFRRAFTTRL
jgi:vesicle-fusing ATPase